MTCALEKKKTRKDRREIKCAKRVRNETSIGAKTRRQILMNNNIALCENARVGRKRSPVVRRGNGCVTDKRSV